MRGATKGTQSVVEFEDNTITLDIDADKVTEIDGWKLRPLNQPLVCLSQIVICCIHTLFFSTSKRLL